MERSPYRRMNYWQKIGKVFRVLRRPIHVEPEKCLPELISYVCNDLAQSSSPASEGGFTELTRNSILARNYMLQIGNVSSNTDKCKARGHDRKPTKAPWHLKTYRAQLLAKIIVDM